MNRLLAFLLLAVLVLPASAQDHGMHHGATARGASSLPVSEETGLLAAHGMGMARAAERNGYPGPLHVLELADSLGLSAAQRGEAQRLYAAMRAEAQPLGAQIVEMENHLDALFLGEQATPEAVARVTQHIGEARGALRAVHLRAHLAMNDALTAEQRARYVALRTPAPVLADTAAARAVAERFRRALVAGDRAAVEALLLPEVRVLESGGIETREEYFGHHYQADVAFLQAMTHTPISQTVEVAGDAAWVMTTSHLAGTYRDRARALASAELLVLRRHDGAWRIAAVHWSSGTRD